MNATTTTPRQDQPVDLRPTELPAAPPELVAYCRQLDDWVNTCTGELKSQVTPAASAVSEAIRQLGNNGSLEEMGLVEFDLLALATNLRQVCELFRQHFPDDPLTPHLATAPALADQPALDPVQEWFAGAAPGKGKPGEARTAVQALSATMQQWACERELDEHTLLQLVHWAAAPFRRRAGHRYQAELAGLITNERGHCPICSREPDLAELSSAEHGRRYLLCLPCDLRWHFKRMGCPHCGNMDFERLGYLLVGNDQAYKIYHCEACKGYLKTIDRRDDNAPLHSPSPLLENARTCFLDILAVEKGYHPTPEKPAEQPAP